MGDLSPHFDTREFTDRRTGEVRVDRELVHVLERLRCVIGHRPIRIVSGYRSESTNRAVGGAPASQHLHGRAADIPAGLANIAQARAAGARGIGVRGGWVVHVDTRPGGAATWSYD